MPTAASMCTSKPTRAAGAAEVGRYDDGELHHLRPASSVQVRSAVVEPWPNWHCVWIEETPDGWMVKCHPHGKVALEPTHLAAFVAGVQHDIENGTHGKSEPGKVKACEYEQQETQRLS